MKEMMMMPRIRAYALCAVVIAAAGCGLLAGRASAAADSAAEQESKLIAVLQSDKPAQDKAMPCKQLVLCGTKAAVPALAALLPDEKLSSWARLPLEAIPDPAADDALREAMGKLQGRLLIGVINSIGFRRDAKAVEGLVQKLKDADVDVASAAAAALGRIGGEQAAKILEQSIAAGPPAVRSVAAEGCILCAERSLAEGKTDEAVRVYDLVRKSDLPKQRVIEGTRGAVLARKSAGIPLLVEQLNSPDKALFGVGLRLARELPGKDTTEALAALLGRLAPERQVLLVVALADRGDVSAAVAVAKCVASDHAEVRQAALSALGVLGDESCVEVLLKGMKSAPGEAPAAREALVRLRANINPALLEHAKSGDAVERAECIFVLTARNAKEAVPAFMEALQAKEEPVRQNAFAGLRQMAGMAEYPELLKRLLGEQDGGTRSSLQDTLVAITRRSEQPAECAQQLLAAWKKATGPSRISVLEIICWLGVPEALAAVHEGLQAPEVEARKSVLRALANWPDSNIVPQLLELARSDRDASVKVLALRVAVPRVGKDAKLPAPNKAARFAEMLKLAEQIEEKKLVLSELKSAPCAASLALAAGLLDEPKLANEAALAIVELAAQRGQLPPAELLAALQKAEQSCGNLDVKKKVQAQIKALPKR